MRPVTQQLLLIRCRNRCVLNAISTLKPKLLDRAALCPREAMRKHLKRET